MSGELDRTALISGVLFTAIGALFLIDQATGVHVGIRWVIPALLIGLGIAGLTASASRYRRDD